MAAATACGYAFYADTLSGAGTNYFLFQGGSGNPSVLSGGLYVGGKLGPISVETANISYNGASQQGLALLDTNAPTGGSALLFYKNNSQIGSVTTTTTSVAYNTTSDERLKDFLGKYDPKEAIRIIRKDPVRAFEWKRDGSRAIGWGAQTSYAISHDLATPGEGEKPWGVDMGKRTPYLWAAMSSVLDRLDAIERRLR